MHFLSLDIYKGKYADFFDLIKNPTQKTLIFTPNPEILLRASKNPDFLNILKQATYNTPDGNGLYVGTMIQEGKSFLTSCFHVFFGKKKVHDQYGELIKGSDLTRDLFDFAQKEGKKILMIDNYRIQDPKNEFEIRKKSIQDHLSELIHLHYPSLHCTLVFDGDETSEALAKLIKKENISYIFSCIGMKKQEERLIEIFSFLSPDQKVVGLGVGASVDFLLGLQKRSPQIFQTLGIEWLYRLILEPKKRGKRIWDALYNFPKQVQKSTHSS